MTPYRLKESTPRPGVTSLPSLPLWLLRRCCVCCLFVFFLPGITSFYPSLQETLLPRAIQSLLHQILVELLLQAWHHVQQIPVFEAIAPQQGRQGTEWQMRVEAGGGEQDGVEGEHLGEVGCPVF